MVREAAIKTGGSVGLSRRGHSREECATLYIQAYQGYRTTGTIYIPFCLFCVRYAITTLAWITYFGF